jgi:hypothetical protein
MSGLSAFSRVNLAYPVSRPNSRGIFRTCPGPQPRHVRPNSIPQRLSPGPNISDPQAGFQIDWPDMSNPDPDMSGFLTHQRLDSLGGYKKTSGLSSIVGHSFHIVNTLRHSFDLPTSLLQASFKFKLPRRDLSLTLE